MSTQPLSRSTLARYKQADRLELRCVAAMVSCKHCAKHSLPYKISSLHKKCINCVWLNVAACELEEIPLPDFSKIDKEMERLEKLEDEEEARLRVEEDMAEAALLRARQARDKLSRLRKQKKLLRRREQELFDRGMSSIEELEDLEAQEALAQAIASVNPEAPLGAATVDWSPLWDFADTGPSNRGS